MLRDSSHSMTEIAMPKESQGKCQEAIDPKDPEHSKRFGLAVLAVDEATEDETRMVDAEGRERAVCARQTVGARPVVCTAHISPEEVKELAATLAPLSLSAPLVVTGDFNTSPEDDEILAMYSPKVDEDGEGSFYEADMCFDELDSCEQPKIGGQGTHCSFCPSFDESWEKIDYAFADAHHFTREMSMKVEWLAEACGGKRCSDHALLLADLTLAAESESESECPTADDPEVDELAGSAEITDIQCVRDYLILDVTHPDADPATGLYRKTPDGWEVIAFGTAICGDPEIPSEPDLLDALGCE